MFLFFSTKGTKTFYYKIVTALSFISFYHLALFFLTFSLTFFLLYVSYALRNNCNPFMVFCCYATDRFEKDLSVSFRSLLDFTRIRTKLFVLFVFLFSSLYLVCYYELVSLQSYLANDSAAELSVKYFNMLNFCITLYSAVHLLWAMWYILDSFALFELLLVLPIFNFLLLFASLV